MQSEWFIANPAHDFYNFLEKHNEISVRKISFKEFFHKFDDYLCLMNIACREMKWGNLNYDDRHLENNLFAEKLPLSAYYKLHICALNKSAHRIHKEIKLVKRGKFIQQYFPFLRRYCSDSAGLLCEATNHFYKVDVSYCIYGTNTSTTFEIYKAAQITLRGTYDEKHIGARLIPKVSVFFIRQAIELRLNKMLGIYLAWDENKRLPKKVNLITEVLELIKQHSNNIALPVPVTSLQNIYKWTNWYIHAGIHAPEYLIESALYFLKPLFSPGRHKTLESIHGSIKIKKSFYESAIKTLEETIKSKAKTTRIRLLKYSKPESIIVDDKEWDALLSTEAQKSPAKKT